MVYKIILLSIVVFLVSSFTLFRKLSDKRIDKEDSKRINSIYQDIGNIYANNTKFISRMNNSVSIETEISEGIVNIVYLMDRDDVAIFKEIVVFTHLLLLIEIR
jgi:hypothetical protein